MPARRAVDEVRQPPTPDDSAAGEYNARMRWWLVGLIAITACGGGDDDDAAGADAAVDAPPGAQWRGLAALPGGPRQETAVVALDGKVYLIGGFDGALAVVTDVWVYDIAGDAWTAGPALPGPAHHINAAVAGGKIYLLGGLTGLSFSPAGFVLEHTPGQPDWIAKTAMPAGSERGASAVGAVGADIYVAGGSRGGSVADVHVYDTGGDQWRVAADLPAMLDHVVGGVVGGAFYVLGGRSNGIGAVQNEVYEYDAAGDAWLPRAPMPTARGGSAAGVAGGLIVVVGGEGNGGDPSGVFPQTEAYDPATDAWQIFDDMRTPRHGTGAAGVGDQLFVPGGADVQGFGAVDTNEVFTLP
jgi:N-acetylneuraminic acid mutarotase